KRRCLARKPRCQRLVKARRNHRRQQHVDKHHPCAPQPLVENHRKADRKDDERNNRDIHGKNRLKSLVSNFSVAVSLSLNQSSKRQLASASRRLKPITLAALAAAPEAK